MKARLTIAVSALVLAAAAGFAQTHQHGAKQHRDAAQPYAGQQARDIASLSAEEQQGFLDGRGMGLAKSAELNGHPGPMHVLEFESELGLTSEQRQLVKAAFDRMKARAKILGEEYLTAERAVDAAFRSGTTDPALVAARVAEANRLLGEVRLSHLVAHIEITPLLTPAQRARYAELRGYGKAHGHHKH
jgi:Spy/CpxP family protein refolding chaperone